MGCCNLPTDWLQLILPGAVTLTPFPPAATPSCLAQSEDPDYKWVLTVMGFWLKFFGGLLGLVLSGCWVLQIILYILIDPPVTPLLNSLFIK